ncbi:MAG: DUF6227 family protein [Streptomyces sp.]|uniref:DUF6227 family protein n=1 Tax=Streptomyces sp. TaxID=1931 RepID=UPI003D6B63E9
MSREAVPTPAEHVRELLARAQNPFDVTDAALARLEDAVLCHVELHGWRQRKTPAPSLRCSSYRHLFLLRDGGVLPLWELRYDHENDAADTPHEMCEVYENVEALARSERRVHQSQERPEPCEVPDSGDAALEFLLTTDTESGDRTRRVYTGSDSPDHARRLLRRAENADRPGEDVWRLLATSRGHDILPVPRPRALAHAWQLWCSVYEHAFLLADGSEISLYELEHDLSGTGLLVCEVYLEENVADQAAHRRARDHGFDL